MGCCGRREKIVEARAEQKWDYINLSDFKSTTCFTPLSYGILYISLLISVAVYAVDLFTAANLLFFDRWSGQVKPAIPFDISRWIFAACIVLSWILLVYRWIRALRAMRSGIVAASYLDPLAVMIQSVRIGANGRGWKRFLIFAELTKGRKGAEYVALFTHFSFEAWLRIIFAEGPRQVINALTLYSVMEANLVPVGQHAAHNGNSAIAQFFINVKILANHDKEQAAILFGMLFTLIIWVIAALSLIMAALSYILFLWHYIPSSDGGLSGYCRRKVDSRLQRIVGVKINTALAKGNITRMRDDVKAASIGEHPTRVVRQPTLPILETKTEDKLPEMPLSRQTTQSTLPAYTSRVPSRDGSYSNSAVDKESVMPDTFPLHSRPMGPSRSTTHSSAWSDASVASNAPLIREAAEMGYGHPARSYSPAPMSRKASDYSIVAGRPKMSRNLTGSSQNSYSPAWNPPRAPGRTTPGRTTPGSLQTRPPVLQSAFGDDLGIHELPNCSPNQQSVRTHASPEVFEAKSQARTPEEYEMHPQRPIAQRGQSESIGEYVAFNPSIYHADSRQAPLPMSQSTSQPRPARNFTMPTRLHQNANLQAGEFILPQRSGTAPIPQDIPYNRIPPQRSGTAPICRDYTYGQTTSNRFFASDNEVSLQDSHAL